MFERYTEKARRVIFFARYESSQFGSAYIETEHLLLGVLREASTLIDNLLPQLHEPVVRKQIEDRTPKRPHVSTSVDLPLSNESKRVLAYAAEESERLKSEPIGPEHLLLGLLREKECVAAQLLHELGNADVSALRIQISKLPHPWEGVESAATPQTWRVNGIEVHGIGLDRHFVREAVKRCREHSWHWKQSSWKAKDVVQKKDGSISFDLSLAEDSGNFTLKKGGWKKDRCVICRWPLFESSDPVHGIGYTNGQDWLCTECHEKFWKVDKSSGPRNPNII